MATAAPDEVQRAAAPEAAPVRRSTPAARPDPGELPSTAYLEWLEHEHDRIDFTPGGRVTVGFKPRRGDAWPVGGQAPRALPAGRAAGRDMARMANGTAWAAIPGSRGSRARQGVRPAAPRRRSRASTPPSMRRPTTAPSRARAVSAVTPEPEPAFDLAAASGLRRQVYGFLPYWEVNGASTKLNYDVLSTIAYFSVGATRKGNLKKRDADGTRDDRLGRLDELEHDLA